MATARKQAPSLEELGNAAGEAPGTEEAGGVHGLVREGPERVEADFPFKIASADDEPIPTRVKMPKDSDVAKAAKSDAKRDRSRPGRSTVAERDLAQLGENLEEKFAIIFGLATGVAPVTATYGIENSPKAINALLDIAKRRPAVLRALTTVADGANALEIGKFALGILVCIQIDTGRLEGTELQSRAFGATEILERFFWEEGEPGERANPNVTGQEVPSAIRRFSRVTTA